jgi:hypothetical protein
MRVALLALCLLVFAPATSTQAEEPRLPTPDEIDGAIERGVAWLLEEQRGPGTWGSGKHAVGKTALATFALLHCGLAEDQDTKASRRLARALRHLDTHGAGRARRRETDTRTYEASLLLMLLRSRGRPEDRERMQRLAALLCRSQAGNGQWWYDGVGKNTAGDNSNTQFAVLALGVARGEGLDVPDTYLRRAMRWWHSSGGSDGGFGYASGGSPKSASTGSMTAAGIACLGILETIFPRAAWRGVDPKYAPAPKGPAAVRPNAVAFLDQVFSVRRNHGPAIDRKNQRQRLAGRGWLHYYLWTVERAMVLAGLEKLGKHDWYALGARHLVDTQKKDGSWRGEHPLYATCFALLFLTRAADPPRAFTPGPAPPPAPGTAAPTTPRPDAPSPAEPEPAPEREPERGNLPPGTVADWLREDLQVGELPRRCRLAGAGSLMPLVRALQDPDEKVRRRAFEALTMLLPDERTRRADRHPLARGRLALWLRLYARHLVLEHDRFVVPD